jgi:dTDP-4-amino-4,6-dideoxygalactose transaminase
MTDIQAAVGREQLRRLPAMIERRRRQAVQYRDLLCGIPGLVLPHEPAWARTNWQSFCVRLPDGCSQLETMQRMLDAGVSTRRGVHCAHREAAYPRNAWLCACRQSPCICLGESECAQDRCIVLPMFHEMSETEQEQVAASLRQALHGGSLAGSARSVI